MGTVVVAALPPRIGVVNNIVGDVGALLVGSEGPSSPIISPPPAPTFSDIDKKNTSSTLSTFALSKLAEFDIADAKWTPALVLGWRGARGGKEGGQTGDVFLRRLIVELGSRCFFWQCGWFNA